MPELDGLAATEIIRSGESDGYADATMAMTAYAMNGDREKCLQAGMDAYVSS